MAEMLSGGNSNQVYRDGNTVIRQCGPSSPLVHDLLRFLEEQGFEQAPKLLMTDGTTETLTYIEGDVGNDPLKPDMLTDAVLVEAAQLLRKFHDVTQHFVVPPGRQTLLPQRPDQPHEVICHNDFAPYNCVYRDGHIVGIIDFDTISPGSRIWDIAYAVYRFAPLMTDQHCLDQGWPTPPDRGQRLCLFCNRYGLDDRAALIDTILQRIQALVDFMRDNHFNEHHIPIYVEDMAYIQANRESFQAALFL